MSRALRHFGAVLIAVGIVCAIGITLNHFIAGPGVGHHVRFRLLPPKGPPPNVKFGGQRNIFVGPAHGGGSVDVHNLLNTLTLLIPGIAIVAIVAAVARRLRRSRRQPDEPPTRRRRHPAATPQR